MVRHGRVCFRLVYMVSASSWSISMSSASTSLSYRPDASSLTQSAFARSTSNVATQPRVSAGAGRSPHLPRHPASCPTQVSAARIKGRACSIACDARRAPLRRTGLAGHSGGRGRAHQSVRRQLVGCCRVGLAWSVGRHELCRAGRGRRLRRPQPAARRASGAPLDP
jgi:hypothetical protein